MIENKWPGLRNYNAVVINAFRPFLNVRTIGRSKCGWRMHGAVGAVHDENCPAARIMRTAHSD
jgi:hypothetical protein